MPIGSEVCTRSAKAQKLRKCRVQSGGNAFIIGIGNAMDSGSLRELGNIDGITLTISRL